MRSSVKAIVSVTNDLYTDQRVHKICTFLLQQGYEVELVGRLRKNSPELEPRSYRTTRLRLLIEKGPFFYAFYNIRLFLYLLFHKADVLVANDLDTLLANYLAFKFKRGCRLVYDSHEYFTEVPELTSRPKVQRIWERIEKWIFPRLEEIYTVNDSIAELYEKKYHKDVRVVRNISPAWHPENILSKEELDIPKEKNLIIIQGAGINIHRGAEEAVEAMQFVDAILMIVGDGDVVPQLKQTVKTLGLEDKVRFYGKKPYPVMMNYTYYADIGLTLDKPNNINYRFSLPNKVFDYIHAETPIICTDLIEVKRIVSKYDIGIILPELSVMSLSQAINALLTDKDRLARYRSNCVMATKQESWETECETLKKIYPAIGQ